jgi:CheY-like chemotaxis protein
MPTALIVEDEVEANKLLSMLLQLRGYQTESAFDAAEAMEKVRKHVPDVIFLDLMLPDLDGHEVCRLLKSARTTSGTPVIIITARVAAGNRMESFIAGADDYIPKPYTPDQVFEALAHARTWVQHVALPRVEGDAVLDGRDDGETLRRLAGLRSLLLAKSGLGPEAVAGISRDIRVIWSSALERSHRSGLEQVASLNYSLTPDSLTLTVHDEGGWLENCWPLVASQVSSMPAGGGFDEVVADHDARCLKLVKRFKPA